MRIPRTAQPRELHAYFAPKLLFTQITTVASYGNGDKEGAAAPSRGHLGAGEGREEKTQRLGVRGPNHHTPSEVGWLTGQHYSLLPAVSVRAIRSLN